jgi:hypothetical protein
MDPLSPTGLYIPIDAALANLDLQETVRRLERNIARALDCLTHLRSSPTLGKLDRDWLDRALIELGLDPEELETAHECFEHEREAVLADQRDAEDVQRREWLATEPCDAND